jgi:hypothetical protein
MLIDLLNSPRVSIKSTISLIRSRLDILNLLSTKIKPCCVSDSDARAFDLFSTPNRS